MSVIHLSRDEVKEGLASSALVLVDVREAHEYAAGHIPGSLSMPLSTFEPETLPADKRVVFSCAAGVRSMHAINAARAAGLRLNEHYAGGFRDWIMAGEDVETGL